MNRTGPDKGRSEIKIFRLRTQKEENGNEKLEGFCQILSRQRGLGGVKHQEVRLESLAGDR